MSVGEAPELVSDIQNHSDRSVLCGANVKELVSHLFQLLASELTDSDDSLIWANVHVTRELKRSGIKWRDLRQKLRND